MVACTHEGDLIHDPPSKRGGPCQKAVELQRPCVGCLLCSVDCRVGAAWRHPCVRQRGAGNAAVSGRHACWLDPGLETWSVIGPCSSGAGGGGAAPALRRARWTRGLRRAQCWVPCLLYTSP